MTREYCDICGCIRPFEPDERTPYVINCAMCGHAMVERTRPARLPEREER